MHGRATQLLLGLLGSAVLPVASAAVDLNGTWRFNSALVPVTQTGSSLTIGLVVPLTGTIGATDPSGFTPYSVGYSDSSVSVFLGGRITPSGNLFDGRGGIVTSSEPPLVSGITATRCTCVDGNITNGDGCDATCQVEPCWTCIGDPSVCSPVADGGACDDRRDCTAGETCTAGICGGGAPVAPCVDMTGLWNAHREIPGQGVVEDYAVVVTQRGGDVQMGGYVGAIDPATGDLDVRAVNLNLFCFAGFDPLVGTVAANGLTYAASGSLEVPQPSSPDHCDSFAVSETGTRCGTSTIEVGEECDDGNLAGGDGCSAECTIEQCWSCSGDPSVCTPVGGGSCDDGSPCTSGDTCASDGTCAGSPIVCDPCLQCDAALGCVAEPLSPCKASATPEKSLLRIKNAADNAKDTFAWKWNDGESTTLAELGDPTAGDDYAVCVYDESGPITLLFRAFLPGGATCDGKPCWKTAGADGFGYRNQAGTPEGVVVARLKSGDPAKAKIKGKGVHLSDHAFGLPSPPLAAPLRVQLQGESGLCLETRHDLTNVLKNDATSGLYKARGAP